MVEIKKEVKMEVKEEIKEEIKEEPEMQPESGGNQEEEGMEVEDAPEQVDGVTMLERKHQSVLAEFERRKELRQIRITTDDNEIRELLRERGQPITLFGEGPQDRRERLRMTIDTHGPIKTKQERAQEEKEKEELTKTTWYHNGPMELKNARYKIALDSLQRIKERKQREREYRNLSGAEKTSAIQQTHRYMQDLSSISSQNGHDRPISFCQFSPNNRMMATASWSGVCKLWSIPECKEVARLDGHSLQTRCIKFHPQSTLSLDSEACNMASCDDHGSVKLWNLAGNEVAELPKHEDRVSKISFHPSGNYLGAACKDASWRLWDLEKQVEILHQEGHMKGVHDIAFQCDGSLALTGGLDAYGRVWDLRTGRCVFFLEGHLKEIYSVAYSPNGYEMATGGADHDIKIWDMRKVSCVYTIPAHKKVVTRLQFQKTRGNFLLSSSYDNTAKIWMAPTYTPLKTLEGHTGFVMGADVTTDDKMIVTCSYDKTFKLWANDEFMEN